jgi:hypothetical protein
MVIEENFTGFQEENNPETEDCFFMVGDPKSDLRCFKMSIKHKMTLLLVSNEVFEASLTILVRKTASNTFHQKIVVLMYQRHTYVT